MFVRWIIVIGVVMVVAGAALVIAGNWAPGVLGLVAGGGAIVFGANQAATS